MPTLSGFAPYNIDPSQVVLPGGIRVKQSFSLVGTFTNATSISVIPSPTALGNGSGVPNNSLSDDDDTTNTTTAVSAFNRNVVPQRFSIKVQDSLSTESNTTHLDMRIGLDDCLTSAFGPNNQSCGTGSCVDLDRHDFDFACDCGQLRLQGDNCITEPTTLAPELAAESASGGGLGDVLYFGGAFAGVILLLVLVVLYVSVRRRREARTPFDFEAEIQRLQNEGLLKLQTNNEGGRRIPKELKRSRIVPLAQIGQGAFGEVYKALFNPDDPTIPEFAVAV
jgi:hypothetical protein